MDRCQVCWRNVDTDFDTEFYSEGNQGTCETCRDEAERTEVMDPADVLEWHDAKVRT